MIISSHQLYSSHFYLQHSTTLSYTEHGPALDLTPVWCLFSISAIQTCISLLKLGRPAPHRESRQKRRELRQKQQAEQEELELRMRELQTANENKQQELEAMRKVSSLTTVNVLPLLLCPFQTTELSCPVLPNAQCEKKTSKSAQ